MRFAQLEPLRSLQLTRTQQTFFFGAFSRLQCGKCTADSSNTLYSASASAAVDLDRQVVKPIRSHGRPKLDFTPMRISPLWVPPAERARLICSLLAMTDHFPCCTSIQSVRNRAQRIRNEADLRPVLLSSFEAFASPQSLCAYIGP